MSRPKSPLRRSRRLAVALAAVSLGLAVGLGAAPALADPPSDWTVQELVVTAHPSPVLWRLSKGDSEVWVLGVLPVMPKDQTWNTKRLERVLEGAHVVLTPARVSADLRTVFMLMTQHSLPPGQMLKAQLPPDLAARLDRDRGLAHAPAGRYAHDKPIWAALMLWIDYAHVANLSREEPLLTVERLARAHGVPVRPIGAYQGHDMLANLLHIPNEAAENCLADVLADIEFNAVNARPAAGAWAIGDIRTVHAHYAEPSLRLCLEQAPSWRVLADRSVEDTVSAVDAALASPGKSVAIFSLDDLLRKGGALDCAPRASPSKPRGCKLRQLVGGLGVGSSKVGSFFPPRPKLQIRLA
jgi:hypothetical protein